MPIYLCRQGSNTHLALDEPGCFLLPDPEGNVWFCVETTLTAPPLNLDEHTEELVRLVQRAEKHGLDIENTAIKMVLAADPADLARLLWADPIQAGHPTAAETAFMTGAIQPDPLPFTYEPGGAIRIARSRVTLETVIREYEEGSDPEAIVHNYPTLQLADVYATIAYYLRHPGEVKAYLRESRKRADDLRRVIEANQPDRGSLRARLLARRQEQEQGHASTRD